MERGRKRQGLVPDFLLELPCLGKKLVLAVLKTLSCCPTRASHRTESTPGCGEMSQRVAGRLETTYIYFKDSIFVYYGLG